MKSVEWIIQGCIGMADSRASQQPLRNPSEGADVEWTTRHHAVSFPYSLVMCGARTECVRNDIRGWEECGWLQRLSISSESAAAERRMEDPRR
jgi:hypothetical protein